MHWTREQLLVALNLYCQMDFGKFHQGNPRIIAVAKQIGRTPSALAMKLCNLASLDPAITASGRKGLAGASALDRHVWAEFQENPDNIGLESQEIMDNLVADNLVLADLSSQSNEVHVESYTGTSITALVKVRKQQHLFRKAILSGYENRCCMTGISHPSLLIASHIVPWASDENNRLNPANGLCLSALHDKAFDKGLITVTPDMIIRVSQKLRDTENSPMAQMYLLGLDGKLITPPHKLAPNPDFLNYHSTKIFLG